MSHRAEQIYTQRAGIKFDLWWERIELTCDLGVFGRRPTAPQILVQVAQAAHATQAPQTGNAVETAQVVREFASFLPQVEFYTSTLGINLLGLCDMYD